MAAVPCLMERDVKESQSKAELINACAFSRVGCSGLTLDNKRRSSVSRDKCVPYFTFK